MRIDLNVPRNGHFFGELRLTDIDGNAIDVTGHAFAMDAREIAGDGTVIASATVAIVEAADGRISVKWRGADFDAVGEPTVDVVVAYDLKETYPDGTIDIPLRGNLILIPEVTE